MAYRSRTGKSERHTLRKSWLVSTLSISPREKILWRYWSCRNCECSLLPNRQRSSKTRRGQRDRALVSSLCRPVRKRYGFKLIGEKYAGIFLYDLVDEHDQLPQCCCRHGRHHSCPQFMQAETQKGLRRGPVHPSRKRE